MSGDVGAEGRLCLYRAVAFATGFVEESMAFCYRQALKG